MPKIIMTISVRLAIRSDRRARLADQESALIRGGL
jgi:hypothetical protein